MSRSGFNAARNGPFKSLFPGICAVCFEAYPIGTPIARKGTSYIHLSCSKGFEE